MNAHSVTLTRLFYVYYEEVLYALLIYCQFISFILEEVIVFIDCL